MDQLEKFIRDHREAFDEEEPRAGHFDRFSERLGEERRGMTKISRIRPWMKVAATAIILVTAGLAGYDLLSGTALTAAGDGTSSAYLSEETREALSYYAGITAERMNEIDRLAGACPQGSGLGTEARRESAAFDANQEELTLALKENPGNEQVEAAMIRNQKLKEKALNNLILKGNMEHCNDK